MPWQLNQCSLVASLGEQSDIDFAPKMIETLDRFHGMVTSVFTGDECLSGKNPVPGTELCAVVEYMFSLEQRRLLRTPQFPLPWGSFRKNCQCASATFGPEICGLINTINKSIKFKRLTIKITCGPPMATLPIPLA